MTTTRFLLLAVLAAGGVRAESFEDLERREYLKPGPSPMAAKPVSVALKEGALGALKERDSVISLDGIWEMAGEGDPWKDAIPAEVPGSVHSALMKAGRLADPYFALNDAEAEKVGYRSWRFRRVFMVDGDTAAKPLRLEFDGVCHTCCVYLNGEALGPEHRGMFGGPEYDVTGRVHEGENTVEVSIRRLPWRKDGINGNGAWRDLVVFNCCYGWHYAQIPAIGIWQSVRLRKLPPASIVDPFISTVSTNGTMDFLATVESGRGNGPLVLEGEIAPKNFRGGVRNFSVGIAADAPRQDVRLRFRIADAKLWWPNGCGAQNLYTLKLRLRRGDGEGLDSKRLDFGVRTIEMRPAGRNSASVPDEYDWKLVVNGVETFMKGTGWCTMDALMRFTKERYARFLGAAKRQNMNFIRAWGCGLVEKDEFYDLCDEYGICVMQEWPTAWDSYGQQPADVLEETVVRGVKRLRSRASLVMWCGGNEGVAPLGDERMKTSVLDMIGRRTLELDGTRPWHRQEGYGRGSTHEYCSSWGRKNVAALITTESKFIGEFGIDCFPCMESIRRYTPDAEWKELERTKGTETWRIDPAGAVAHHTPKFQRAKDVSRLSQHVWMFLPSNSLENVVLGSQLAQAVGVRHTLERSRTRFPECAGAAMYKLNDVYPAASWATVDWYGVEKYASFVVSDSFAPLTAIAVFDKLRCGGEALPIPFFLVDDADELAAAKGWKASLRVYDSGLALVKELPCEGTGSVGRLRRLGALELTSDEASSVPLWVVADVRVDGKSAGRNFYFLNFEEKQGCLFTAPRTRVAMSVEGRTCVFRNNGKVPAINVHFVCPKSSQTFVSADNFFWLDPGEEKRVEVNDPAAIEKIAWWNGEP